MFEKVKQLFKKNRSILWALPESAVEKISAMVQPAMMMTDRTFFLLVHNSGMTPDQLKEIDGTKIIPYAEKKIFWMPVRIIPTEQWTKSKQMQMMIPYNHILFIDLSQYDPKGKTGSDT